MVISVPDREFSPLVVVAGGGTGGHLFPALAVADALRERMGGVRFLFFGSRRAIDSSILRNTGWELIPQPLMAIDRAPWRWPRIANGLIESGRLCRNRFERDRPAVVLGTGGLSSFPAMCEAIRMRIPTALLNPDARPGRANRFLAGAVDKIFVQWSSSVEHFPEPSRVVVSGCPVRSTCWNAARDAGIRCFGLESTKKTLLVTGASQGARSINQAVLANLGMLEACTDWQVLHLCGKADHEVVRDAYAHRSILSVVLPFTDRMGEALAVADLVVSRAGASTLAELAALGLPSILMPYPHHKDRHQYANALCMTKTDTGPAAVILEDQVDPAINGPALKEILQSLMRDHDRRLALATSAARAGRRDAAGVVAGHLCQMIHSERSWNRCDSLEGSCTVSR